MSLGPLFVCIGIVVCFAAGGFEMRTRIDCTPPV